MCKKLLSLLGSTVLSVLLVTALIVHAADDPKENSADPAQGPHPKIEFKKLTHDFGQASQNASLHHSFIFKNTGQAALTVEKVKAG